MVGKQVKKERAEEEEYGTISDEEFRKIMEENLRIDKELWERLAKI